MDYEVVYQREDGSKGAYTGDNKEAFEVELDMCIRMNWEFVARVRKTNKK